jgi:hypothetical protein
MPKRVDFGVETVSYEPFTLKIYLRSRRLARQPKKELILRQIEDLHSAFRIVLFFS